MTLSQNLTTFSCLIPFHNEGRRTLVVLAQVTKVKGLNEIICIDDGSTDNASELIRKTFPQVKLISLPTNMGKTEAVKRGAEQATGDYLLLLDADLRNLDHIEIEAAITTMQQDETIDMAVLRRINAPWNIKLFRGDVLIPGERIIKRQDLLQVIERWRPTRFQLEFAINRYMMANRKSVYWLPSSASNTWPTTKLGFFKGMGKIISMQANILSYIGLSNYLKLWLFFCRNTVPLRVSEDRKEALYN